jgi:hypothetical protein
MTEQPVSRAEFDALVARVAAIDGDPVMDVLRDAITVDNPQDDSYRIALRSYEAAGGAGQDPSEWDGTSPPLDDIVVQDVAMFRMEDMGDYFWMSCYLNGGDEQITFNVRRGNRKKGEPGIVVEAYEFPDVTYETRTAPDA